MDIETWTSATESFLDLSTNISNNNNTNNTNSVSRDETLVSIEIAVLGTCFTLAVINNLCVLLVLLWRRKKITQMELYIFHLSIADLIVAFFNILPQLIWDITFRFMAGDAMCRFVKYAQMFSLYLSTYVLIMTAIDRYCAICHPLSNKSRSPLQVHCKILTAYGIATIFSIPQAILFHIQEVEEGAGVYDCWVHFDPPWILKAYGLYIFCALYLIPLMILIFTYGSICYTIWIKHHNTNRKTRKETKPGSFRKRKKDGVFLRSHSVHGFSRAKLNSVKLTFAIIITYIICWSPFFVSQIWWLFDENVVINASVAVIVLLASLNSCTNPWIYLIFNWNHFSQFFPCIKSGQARRQHRYSATANTELDTLSQCDSPGVTGSIIRNRNSLRNASVQFHSSDKTTIL